MKAAFWACIITNSINRWVISPEETVVFWYSAISDLPFQSRPNNDCYRRFIHQIFPGCCVDGIDGHALDLLPATLNVIITQTVKLVECRAMGIGVHVLQLKSELRQRPGLGSSKLLRFESVLAEVLPFGLKYFS